MKKSIFFLSFLFFLFSCTAKSQTGTVETQVGNLVNGEPVFSVNKQNLINVYNANLLQASEINGNFTSVNIATNSLGEYNLVFIGPVYKSTFYIVLNSQNQLLARAAISCTTSDCAEEPLGCVPQPGNTACWPCKNKGKCTKTVSSNSMLEQH